ncbi:hypothetical protein [Candidatus Nitrosopumilus sp. SW]|uniref:hypothetical protein n=1 Tax=Candidatus Nitrosopumilus sp. SW TaxID=2508726 RepID=UPI0021034C0C|nr:hypothetical protein [Candidatus Nitrosopumilus sp. SW]
MSEVKKDEEAQLQWELETKRIQKIKNPAESVEEVSEPIEEHDSETELPEISIKTSYDEKPSTEINSAALLETASDAEVNSRISFEEFTDEKTLISHDAFGNKQMKIKVLEVSDETPP